MSSTLTKVAIVGMSLVLPVAASQRSPSSGQVSVTIRNNEVFLEDPSGNVRQVTRDGEYKEHAALRPDGQKLVYHGRYDAYALPRQQPVVTILDVQTGMIIQSITLQWDSRYVDKMSWVNGRYVAVYGEELVILDAERGSQLHRLPGGVISPDGEKIVFPEPRIPRYGPRPKQLESTTVALALVDKPYDKSIGRDVEIDRAPFSPSVRIFPVTSSWDEPKEELWSADLAQRHSLCGDLLWAPDSRGIAFVEYHRGTFWAVFLALDIDNPQVRVQQRRIELSRAVAEIASDGMCRGGTRVDWVNGTQLMITGTHESYLVDVRQGHKKVIKAGEE